MKKIILFLVLILTILIVSCTKPAQQPQGYQPTEQVNPPTAVEPTPSSENVPEQPTPLSPMQEQQQPNQTQQPIWKLGGLAISGKYADADIVEIENGKYRMYYSAEPEVPGFKGQAYSAVSSDGKNWLPEEGTRMEWATFPSVLKLPDGRYRMYFQNQGVIKSAVSTDGLSFKEENGVRIDMSNSLGLRLENVAAPTVIKTGNTYLMVYRGTINERYAEEVPNNNIQLFLWATSQDGLNFEKKGIALDSRNTEFQGLLDGPKLVEWDDGLLRLYFWSYKGVYHIIYKDGEFSKDAIFDYTTNGNPLNKFPENPPSDPTLAKISGIWLMYYGQHTKGIYYALMEEAQ